MEELLVEVITGVKHADVEVMKSYLVKAFTEMKSGGEVTVTSDKGENGGITCMIDVDLDSYGYGQGFSEVRFNNPESVINLIVISASHVSGLDIGIDVEDLSDTEVEITIKAIDKNNQTKH